jgi:hypothetical protein
LGGSGGEERETNLMLKHLPDVFNQWFYAGLSVALLCGGWLSFLWQPERQVRLHSEHLVSAVEKRNWSAAGEFVASDYRDQWGNDRVSLLERLHQGLAATRDLHFSVADDETNATGPEGSWHAKITLTGGDDFAQPMVKRINSLSTPFDLHWRHVSGKRWDWKLTAVSNSQLELPD